MDGQRESERRRGVAQTHLRSRQVWPEGHHNLDIIAERCGFDLKNHHNALADAEACADPISKI